MISSDGVVEILMYGYIIPCFAGFEQGEVHDLYLGDLSVMFF